MNKKCNTCGAVKLVSDFNKCKSKSDGLAGPCRDCQHKNGKKHYEKRKEHFVGKAIKRAVERRRWLYKLKDNKPCYDCNVVHRYFALEYDHRDPKSKFKEVSVLAGWGQEKILEEIAKCDLVCANCHRYRTYARRKNTAL